MTAKMQELLYSKGITHFICLIDRDQLRLFNPYMDKIKPLKKPEWLNFEIVDQQIATDEEVLQFVDKLKTLSLNSKNCLYIHCWGGNGRTATLSAILLAKMYGWDWRNALEHIFKCYLMRKVPTIGYLPETEEQFKQIQRLCAAPSMNFEEWKRICEGLKKELRPDLN